MTRRPTRLTLNSLEDRATPAVAGSLDPTFGTNGIVTLSDTPAFSNYGVSNVVRGPDGSVVAAVQDNTSTVSSSGFVRYTNAGVLDTSFGVNGFASNANSLLGIDGAGRILTTTGTGNTFGVSRLTSSGALDTSFGNGGTGVVQRAGDPASTGQINAAVFQADGKVVLAGTSGSVIEISRLNADGQQDTSFANDGVLLIPRPIGSQNLAIAKAISLMPDGRIVVAGTALQNVSGKFGDLYTDTLIARILPNGQLDSSYGSAGIASLGVKGPNEVINSFVALADGTVYLTGGESSIFSSPQAFSNRVTPSGQLDSSFSLNVADVTPGATAVKLAGDGQAVFYVRTNTYPSGSYSLSLVSASDQNVPSSVASNATGYATGSATGVVPGSLLSFSGSKSSIARVLLADTAFPTPAGTVSVSGSTDGRLTPLQTTSVGLLQPVTPLNVYPGFPGTARTATADVNGDGVADYVTGPGPGGGPNVVVTDGRTGAKIADLNAFETTFTGGVFVAAADLNGDGKAEVVVTPDQGGGPVVVIYDGAGLTTRKNEGAELTRFFGIDDAAFRGGARPALGDTNGDGRPDLVVAAGFGGGPRVALYDGSRISDRSKWPTIMGGFKGFQNIPVPPKLMGDFFVFEPTLRNGVFVAAGDLTGDGKAEVVVGGGPGGGPRVMALDGSALAGGQMTPVVNFFAGDASGRGGVRVAVRPAADGSAQLVTGSGEGQPGWVNVYKAATARAGGPADQTLSPFGDAALADGVYVG